MFILCPPTIKTASRFKTNSLTKSSPSDIENKYKLPVITQVIELQETCCEEKITTKKVPYIAKVKKNGKTVSVIKYKTQKISEQVTYMEEVLVDKTEYKEKVEIIPGFVGTPGNISIYPSVSAMQNEVAALGRAVLCAFGFSENCK